MTTTAEPFVPRYPPLDLELAARRIAEREAAVREPRFGAAARAAVEADTEIMKSLLLEARNLRLANEALKEVIAEIKRGKGT